MSELRHLVSFSGLADQLSRLSPETKKTVAEISQLPVHKNATAFELFQLKISEDALYQENDEVQISLKMVC
jgi:hypothetical protein